MKKAILVEKVSDVIHESFCSGVFRYFSGKTQKKC